MPTPTRTQARPPASKRPSMEKSRTRARSSGCLGWRGVRRGVRQCGDPWRLFWREWCRPRWALSGRLPRPPELLLLPSGDVRLVPLDRHRRQRGSDWGNWGIGARQTARSVYQRTPSPPQTRLLRRPHTHRHRSLAFDAHIETKTVKDRKKDETFLMSAVMLPIRRKQRKNDETAHRIMKRRKNVRFALESTGISAGTVTSIDGNLSIEATSAPNSRHVHSTSCHFAGERSADGENETNCVAISTSFFFFLSLFFSIYLFCYFGWFVRK